MRVLEPEQDSAEELVGRVLSGDRRALAKSITCVESMRPSDRQRAKRLLTQLLPHSGGSIRIGITGAPGVGKSTFIDALGMEILSNRDRVAVLAIDPSSSRTGGCILGDKTRMSELAASDRAFIRPSPSQGNLGGVARSTRESLVLCEAAGFNVALVETVGVGQSEFAVAEMVDIFVMLVLPGAGDELQGIKRGILEAADFVAVTKADGDNCPRAQIAQAQYSQALSLCRGSEKDSPAVVCCSALEGTGIKPLWLSIREKHSRMLADETLHLRRAKQRRAWFICALENALHDRFFANKEASRLLPRIADAVERSEITPEAAVEQLLLLTSTSGQDGDFG